MATFDMTSDTVIENDYPAHDRTYRAFLRGVRLSVAVAAATLGLLAYFLL